MNQYFITYKTPERVWDDQNRTWKSGWRRHCCFLQACSMVGAKALMMRFVPYAQKIKVEMANAE